MVCAVSKGGLFDSSAANQPWMRCRGGAAWAAGAGFGLLESKLKSGSIAVGRSCGAVAVELQCELLTGHRHQFPVGWEHRTECHDNRRDLVAAESDGLKLLVVLLRHCLVVNGGLNPEVTTRPGCFSCFQVQLYTVCHSQAWLPNRPGFAWSDFVYPARISKPTEMLPATGPGLHSGI